MAASTIARKGNTNTTPDKGGNSQVAQDMAALLQSGSSDKLQALAKAGVLTPGDREAVILGGIECGRRESAARNGVKVAVYLLAKVDKTMTGRQIAERLGLHESSVSTYALEGQTFLALGHPRGWKGALKIEGDSDLSYAMGKKSADIRKALTAPGVKITTRREAVAQIVREACKTRDDAKAQATAARVATAKAKAPAVKGGKAPEVSAAPVSVDTTAPVLAKALEDFTASSTILAAGWEHLTPEQQHAVSGIVAEWVARQK